MTPEQKEAFRREVLEALDCWDSYDDIRDAVKDAVDAFFPTTKPVRALAASQPAPAAYETLRQNVADNWAAFTAMRNDINEIIGDMPSSESTLAHGPEMQHECAAVVEAVRKAFKPAPAADTGQAVAVRALEWMQDGKNFWKAAVTWGEYHIAYNQSSRMGQWLWNSGVMEGWLPVDTFDIAKSQAQADYERRILSALADPVSPAADTGQAVEDMVTAMRDKWGNANGTQYEQGVWDQSQRILGKLKAHPAPPAADTGKAVADKTRNQIINRCSYDLARLVQSHSPDQTSLNNLVWDRLQTMACEIEDAHPTSLDAERVREDERDQLFAVAKGRGLTATAALLGECGAMWPADRAALRQKEGKA